jgi:hypothetical protein
MAFLLVTLAGGGFGTGVSVSLGGDGQSVKINSPFSLNITIGLLSVLGIVIASSLMGNPVYRDFEYRTHSLFYTTPISKIGYLGGRFLGSYLVAALVFSGIAVGAALATVMPWVVADRFLAVAPAGSYVWPYLVLVLPNLLFSGAVFFTMATLTRNILSTYIGSVLLLVAYLVSSPTSTTSRTNTWCRPRCLWLVGHRAHLPLLDARREKYPAAPLVQLRAAEPGRVAGPGAGPAGALLRAVPVFGLCFRKDHQEVS